MRLFGWNCSCARLAVGALVTTLAIAFALGCGPKARMAAKATARPAPVVVVAPVVTKTTPIYGEYVAQTEASSTVTIRSRVEGVLTGMHFREGGRVGRGQLLYEVDPSTYQANLSSAKAQLAKARADLAWCMDQVRVKVSEASVAEAQARLTKAEKDVARIEPLVAAKAIPAKELDSAIAAVSVAQSELESSKARLANTKLSDKSNLEQARAAVQSAEATVAKAQLDLGYTKISAPISGVVGRTQFTLGNLVGRPDSSVLNTVSAINPIFVNFSISESDYLRLLRALGKHWSHPSGFKLLLADDSEYGYTGRFGTLERALDPKTGTMVVRSVFPNPEGLLRPGLFGRVRIKLGERPGAIIVPQRAVQDIQGNKMVLLLGKNNKAVFRSVEIRDRFGTDYVISSGVKPGDIIITDGIQKVAPGMIVKPTNKPVTVREIGG